jgi:hypothetical protein
MLCDDSVHAAQCTRLASEFVTMRVSVVLPTPAGPMTTTPRRPPSSAERIA